jgi:hypothetical protein
VTFDFIDNVIGRCAGGTGSIPGTTKIVYDDFCTALRELQCMTFSKAVSCTCNDDNLVIKSNRHLKFPLFVNFFTEQ